jgi:predicted ribosomally synthesized peptide with SipW-like signal peptide
MALGRSAVVLSALAVGALLATGGTYAAFSDYGEVTGNEIVAGTVVVGADGGAAPDLHYADLQPAVSSSDGLSLRYAGTIPADLWLELEPGSAADAFCSSSGDSWSARPGGSLQIQVGSGSWTDYCAALSGQRFPIASGVPTSTTLDVPVAVRLTDGTDARYSGLAGVDGLVVKALQTGGQGFSDFARGSISIGAGTIAPVIPQECVAAGLTGFDASTTIYLTQSGVYDAPRQPEQGRGYLIVGTDGDDVITGSNQADCIVGGGGNDHLIGGNQGDVLLGGDGDDVLNGGGGDASDNKPGGNGKDWLYGQAGNDELHGANGKDLLDGGDDVDTCVDTANGNANGQGQGNGQDAGDGAAQGNPGGNGDDTFVHCESDGTAPAEAGPGAGATSPVAGSDAPEAADTANELGLVDPGQPDGASTGTGGEPTPEPTTTPATAPAPAATAVPTADGNVAGGDGSTPSPSPLSTVVIATEGS